MVYMYVYIAIMYHMFVCMIIFVGVIFFMEGKSGKSFVV